MKNFIKKLVTGSIRMARNLFYRRFFRKQLRKQFLRPSDVMPDDFKKEIAVYWRRFGLRIDNRWHRWYSSRSGIRDVRYIPEDLYYCRIEPALNRQQFSVPLADKSIFDLMMPDFKKPVTIARNVNGTFTDSGFRHIEREQAIEACKDRGEIVIKPTIDSGGGRRVEFFTPGAGENASRITEDMFKKYGKDFIVQESIRQHPELGKLNADSVNTLKIMSLLWNDEIYIMLTIVRVGLENQRVDNLAIGGHCLGVDENGIFRTNGFTKYGEPITVLPNGYVFGGRRVPGYQNAVEVVKRAHYKLGQFRLVSWDIAIEPDETPVLIEYNTFYQGINLQQLSCGPLFGEMTDEVLKFVFRKDIG